MKVQKLLIQHLNTHLLLDFLEVINESYFHNTPPNAESHFKLTIVSDSFEDQDLVKRHQKIYKLLDSIITKNKIHALSLHIYTKSEWNKINKKSPDSPKCLGDSKKIEHKEM